MLLGGALISKTHFCLNFVYTILAAKLRVFDHLEQIFGFLAIWLIFGFWS